MDIPAGPALEVLNSIFKTIKISIVNYIEERKEKKKENWDILSTQLTMIQSLVRSHLDAIKIVRGSLSDRGDLRTAAEAFKLLVENDDLPLGYDRVRGTVKRLSQIKEFSESSRGLMVEMLARLRDFQLAAFMIDPETWAKGHLPSVTMVYAFDSAVKLLPLLEKQEKSPEDIKDIIGHGSFVLRELAGIEGVWPNSLSKTPFEKSDEVVKLATEWCNSWLERVRAPLVSGKGVMATIGALEAQRPTG